MKLINLLALLVSLNISVGFALTCAEADTKANELSNEAYSLYNKAYEFKYTYKTYTVACQESERKMAIWSKAGDSALEARNLWLTIAEKCESNRTMANQNASEEDKLADSVLQNWNNTEEFHQKTCAKAKAYAESINQ